MGAAAACAPPQARLCPSSAHSIDRPGVTVHSATKHQHRINAHTARPPSRDSSAHPFPERVGGFGGGSESQDRRYPRNGRESEGKRTRDSRRTSSPVQEPRDFSNPWCSRSSDQRPASHLGQGAPSDASVAYGSLSLYAIPGQGGEARRAKGDKRREGESSVFRRIKRNFFSVLA